MQQGLAHLFSCWHIIYALGFGRKLPLQIFISHLANPIFSHLCAADEDDPPPFSILYLTWLPVSIVPLIRGSYKSLNWLFVLY